MEQTLNPKEIFKASKWSYVFTPEFNLKDS